MEKISRIQLRGISRTPSDRLNSDGGCAESLNVYLDEAESAPALLPVDVTSDLDIPSDSVYEVLFLHSGIGYNNPICQQGGNVGTWEKVDGEYILRPFIVLEEGETVRDVDALGNSLIIATDRSLHYVLKKPEGYKYLGTNIPMPVVQLYDQAPEHKAEYNSFEQVLANGEASPAPYKLFLNWNEYDKDEDDNEYNRRAEIQDIIKAAWHMYKTGRSEARKESAFTNPLLVKYAIRLKTGEYVDSDPFLVGGGLLSPVYGEGYAMKDENGYWTSRLKVTISSCYNLALRLYNGNEYKALLEDWKDVVSSLDVFISTDIFPDDINIENVDTVGNEPLSYPYNYAKAITQSSVNGSGIVNRYDSLITFGNFTDEKYREKLLEKANFYLAESFTLVSEDSKVDEDTLDKLINSTVIDTEAIMDNTLRVEQQPVDFTYRARHQTVANSVTIFNSRVILSDVATSIPSGANVLSGRKINDALDPPRKKSDASYYRFKFFVRGETALTKNGQSAFGDKYYVSEIMNGDSYTWLTYPDNRCYKVAIEKTTTSGEVFCKTFDMKEHPNLPIAYLYLGAETAYGTAVNAKESIDFTKENPMEKESGKIYVSSVQSPFVFPLEGRYTVGSSRVIGVAIASTALSQGQFGQFPLYVFTEDGIWAMETAADGSFVTSKPLSRDVCINPDSITSIDNAVVFVTDRGVMLLQGSQVVNISPNMNGRHYAIEENAKVIINGQDDFKDLIPVLADDTPFMAFVKDASIAYDYSGRRLIFIKKDEDYQYIYKLDTSTWHKTAYGIDMVAPINSYPDALVQTEVENLIRLSLYVEDAYMYDDQTFDLFLGEVEYLKILSEEQWREMFFTGKSIVVTVTEEKKAEIDVAIEAAEMHAQVTLSYDEEGKVSSTRIFNLSTPLDIESQTPTKGVIATRAIDLGAPDTLKTITDIKVRGQYSRGAVKYVLLGSMDGMNYHVINTRRGKAWKFFRLVILADLKPTERISWIDVTYVEKFTNKLR